MAALAILIVMGIGVTQTPWIKGRLTNQGGVGDRVALWKANLDFFNQRPLTGVGFGKNQELSLYYFKEKYPNQNQYFIGHAHNVYLEIIAGIGLLGAIAWVLWWISLFRPLARVLQKPLPLSFPTGALSAWIVFLMNGLTQVNFWEGKVLHQVMWNAGLILFWSTSLSSAPKQNVS